MAPLVFQREVVENVLRAKLGGDYLPSLEEARDKWVSSGGPPEQWQAAVNEVNKSVDFIIDWEDNVVIFPELVVVSLNGYGGYDQYLFYAVEESGGVTLRGRSVRRDAIREVRLTAGAIPRYIERHFLYKGVRPWGISSGRTLVRWEADKGDADLLRLLGLKVVLPNRPWWTISDKLIGDDEARRLIEEEREWREELARRLPPVHIAVGVNPKKLPVAVSAGIYEEFWRGHHWRIYLNRQSEADGVHVGESTLKFYKGAWRGVLIGKDGHRIPRIERLLGRKISY